MPDIAAAKLLARFKDHSRLAELRHPLVCMPVGILVVPEELAEAQGVNHLVERSRLHLGLAAVRGNVEVDAERSGPVVGACAQVQGTRPRLG